MLLGATITSSAAESFLAVKPLAYRSISGIVLDERTGRPIADARVLAVWTGATYSSNFVQSSSAYHCLRFDAQRTRADGRFSISAPLATVYRVGLAQQALSIRVHAPGMAVTPDARYDGSVSKYSEREAGLLGSLLPVERDLETEVRMVPATEDVTARLRELEKLAREPRHECATRGSRRDLQAFYDALKADADALPLSSEYERSLVRRIATHSALALGLRVEEPTLVPRIISAEDVVPEDRDDPRWRDGVGATRLWYAIQGADVAWVRRLLDRGVDVNATAEPEANHGATALMAAVRAIGEERVNKRPASGAREEILRMLLRHPGIDPDRRNRGGHTPLMVAVKGSLDDVVELLVVAGADPNLEGHELRETAFRFALKELNRGGAPASAAAWRQLEALLRSPKLEIDHGKPRLAPTPLLDVAGWGEPAVLKRLLDAGADPNAVTSLGSTPAAAAVRAAIGNPAWPRFQEAAREIISRPSVRGRIEYEGKPAIQHAREAGREDLVTLLAKVPH